MLGTLLSAPFASLYGNQLFTWCSCVIIAGVFLVSAHFDEPRNFRPIKPLSCPPEFLQEYPLWKYGDLVSLASDAEPFFAGQQFIITRPLASPGGR